jgi:hypothetical protein
MYLTKILDDKNKFFKKSIFSKRIEVFQIVAYFYVLHNWKFNMLKNIITGFVKWVLYLY